MGTRDYRVASRRKGAKNASGVKIPGKGLAQWDIGKTAMTAISARSVANQLSATYPDYEHCVVRVDREGRPL